MDSKTNKPAPESMSIRNTFDIISQSVAILGGLVSIIILILTLRAGTEQRARELRWNQSRLAMELVDGTLHDPLALNALNMLDWNYKEYNNREVFIVIDSLQVYNALNVENNLNLPENGEFIRESFDRLFYHLGKIERSLKSGLVVFEDVSSPIDYYIPFLRYKYRNVLIPYMIQLHHKDASDFLARFPHQ